MSIPFFIPEKYWIIHTVVNNSSWPMCAHHQTLPEFAWERTSCYSKSYALKGIWATKQSDTACELVFRPAWFISINVAKRTIAIFRLTITNRILTLYQFSPEMYSFCTEVSIAEEQSRCFISYQVKVVYIKVSNFLLVWKIYKSLHKSFTVQILFFFNCTCLK